MATTAFGEFLHNVHKRTKGTQIAKNAGISYVYLLDLEKGARPIPSDAVLMALADVLPFDPGEREHFFDLAATEKECAPLDVSTFIKGNTELINIIRQIEHAQISVETLRTLTENVEDKGGPTYLKACFPPFDGSQGSAPDPHQSPTHEAAGQSSSETAK